MSGVAVLIAIIVQLLCMIGAAAEFGLDAGLYVLLAVTASAIQGALVHKKK